MVYNVDMTLNELKSKLAPNTKNVVDLGGGRVRIEGVCGVTGKPYSVETSADNLAKFQSGMFAQSAFPDLSASDREFIISGTSPEGWEILFGDDEEEDGETSDVL